MATDYYDDYDIQRIEHRINDLERIVSTVDRRVSTVERDVDMLNTDVQHLNEINYYASKSEEELVNDEIAACQRAIQKLQLKIDGAQDEMTASVLNNYMNSLNEQLSTLNAWKNGDKTVKIPALEKRKSILEENSYGDINYKREFEPIEESVKNIRVMNEMEKNNVASTKASLKDGFANGLLNKRTLFTTAGGAGLGALISTSMQKSVGQGALYGALGGASLSVLLGIFNGVNEARKYKRQEANYYQSIDYLQNRGLLAAEGPTNEKGMGL